MSDSNPYASSSNLSPQNEKTIAVLGHLLAIPFEFFAPLLGYLIFNKRGPFVSHHVKESLNFSITMLLVVFVLAISIIGWILLWLPPIYWFIFRIVAAVKTSQGEFYAYPLTLRLIKN